MLARTLWSLLRGYVIIRAKGGRMELFINEAVAAGVHLWRLERATSRLLVARAAAADFARLCRIGRRQGVSVSILGKRGIPFALLQARQRKLFVGGGALFVLLIYGLAQFVWFVDVRGTERVTPEAVLATAAGVGLRPGVLRSGVERDAVVHGLHSALPTLAWAGVELRGAMATVRVVERTEADATRFAPGHVVAEEDGLVERLVVMQGQALVSAGDTVEEGQVLISGMLTPGSDAYAQRIKVGEPPFLRAEGSVWGRVWYRGYAEVTLPSGQAMTEADVAAAAGQAIQAADAAVAERISSGDEIVDRTVAIYEELSLQPAVVRATVTVAVYKSLGRFSPVTASSEADGNGSKDEDDEQEDGRFQRTGQ